MGFLYIKKADVDITASSSTDIHYIEAKYRRDKEEEEENVPVDISLVIDVEH